MKHFLLSLLGSLVLFGCASGRVNGVEQYLEGIQKASAGDREGASAAFYRACEVENPAGCLRVGKRATSAPPPRLAVLQGPTNDTVTQIAVSFEGVRPILGLWESGTQVFIKTAKETLKKSEGSEWQVLQVRYEGLDPKKEYSLEIISKGGELLDLRTLKTLDTKKRLPTIAIASCMDDDYKDVQSGIWKELLSSQPDLIFLLGDNVYADHRDGKSLVVDPKVLWARYAETRNLLALFRTETLVPVFATWDDHDFGSNDGGKSFPYKEASKIIFNSYFPQEAIPGFFDLGPGVSSRFQAFGQKFYLMDDRYFRTAAGELPDSHWGDEQESWLWDGLKSSSSPSWILDGDQFFGAYHKFESFERLHPQSFKKFIAGLRQLRYPVVLVSGDRHLAELMDLSKDLGYPSFELTTSAIHAKTYPDAWKDTPNFRQIEGASGTINYMIVRSQADSRGLSLSVVAYGPGRKMLFTRGLKSLKK